MDPNELSDFGSHPSEPQVFGESSSSNGSDLTALELLKTFSYSGSHIGELDDTHSVGSLESDSHSIYDGPVEFGEMSLFHEEVSPVGWLELPWPTPYDNLGGDGLANPAEDSDARNAQHSRPSWCESSFDENSDSEDDDVSVHDQIAADFAEDRLLALASRIAAQHLQLINYDAKVVDRQGGSYNAVYIIELKRDTTDKELTPFKIALRTPRMNGGVPLSQAAAQAMKSQAVTLRLIREKTNIPVPEVYAVDVTAENEIQMPFMCMSFLNGQPLHQLWLKNTRRPHAQEQMRLKVLSSLAQVMAQFSLLTFEKYGSISEDEYGSIVLGPNYELGEGRENGMVPVIVSEQHESAYECVVSKYQKSLTLDMPEDIESPYRDGKQKTMELLLRCLGKLDASFPGYVLCPPDFDSQNILVDDQGNVTGLVDWDLIKTMPRYVGYTAYPKFLTMDWDPLNRDWNLPKQFRFAESTAALARYRSHYGKELDQALHGQQDCGLTQRSHIIGAIWFAANESLYCSDICMKFLSAVKSVRDSTERDFLSMRKVENKNFAIQDSFEEYEREFGNLSELLAVGSCKFTKEEMADLKARLEKLILG